MTKELLTQLVVTLEADTVRRKEQIGYINRRIQANQDSASGPLAALVSLTTLEADAVRGINRQIQTNLDMVSEINVRLRA